MKLTFYRDNSRHRDWRWSVIRKNGRNVAASTEGYRRRIDSVRNALSVLQTDKMDVRIVGPDGLETPFDIDPYRQ